MRLSMARNALSFTLAPLSRRRKPLNVMWRLTNRCNAACSYCPVRSRKQKELTTTEVLKLTDEMYSLGTRRIGFVGGEALLREDFGEIVRHARAKGIYVTLVSNGTLVAKNMDIVKELDCLVLSLDGRKKSHEQGRTPGSHAAVLAALKACKENGVHGLTNTVLNKYNLGDMRYVVETAALHGFSCTFNLLQGSGDSYPTDDAYRAALTELLAHKKAGAPIVLSARTIRYLLAWSDYRKFMTTEQVAGFTCYAGRLLFNIDTDGTLATCDIMSHKKRNPSCVELGFKQAMARVEKDGCKACTCAHVIEYNWMFGYKLDVVWGWVGLLV